MLFFFLLTTIDFPQWTDACLPASACLFIFEFLRSPLDQRAISVVEYVLTTVVTELVTIPAGELGRSAGATETISRGRSHLLVLLRRWYECILTIHD